MRFRRPRPRRAHPSPEVALARLEKGEGGERALQDWLDRSRLAYLLLDQSPLTIPAAHRADIKRPDFLVAVDGSGTIAVDAKAKAFIDGCLVLDASERRRLEGFEIMFGIPVWYACFPPDSRTLAYLFRNRDLIGADVSYDAAKQIVRAPLALGVAVVRSATPFAAALCLRSA
jgi:hypothetical protein